MWEILQEIVRKKIVQYTTDQEKLYKIAIKDEFGSACSLAVEKITDQEKLYKIVIKDKFGRNSSAVRKMTDQSLLKDVALNHNSMQFRELAINNIKDQEALEKVVLGNKYSSLKALAAEKVTDQNRLLKFASEYEFLNIEMDDSISFKTMDKKEEECKSILKNVSDELILAKIVIRTKCRYMRAIAAERITSQALLGKIVLYWAKKGVEYDDLCIDVVKKVTHLPIWHEVAVNGKSYYLINTAIKMVDDEKLISKLAFHKEFAGLRATAIENISDQAVICKVALNDPEDWVRKCALEKLTNQGVLGEVAQKDVSLRVALLAAKKLTDDFELAKTALNCEHDSVREIATQRVTDQATLEKIAINEKEGLIREIAVSRLTDQKTLAKVALNDEKSYVREAAVNNITDKSMLVKINTAEKMKEEKEPEKLIAPSLEKEVDIFVRNMTIELSQFPVVKIEEMQLCAKKYYNYSILVGGTFQEVAEFVYLMSFNALKKVTPNTVMLEGGSINLQGVYKDLNLDGEQKTITVLNCECKIGSEKTTYGYNLLLYTLSVFHSDEKFPCVVGAFMEDLPNKTFSPKREDICPVIRVSKALLQD